MVLFRVRGGIAVLLGTSPKRSDWCQVLISPVSGRWPLAEALACLCVSSERTILAYIRGSGDLPMRKNVLTTLVLMATMIGTAAAAKQTAFCPYDGQLAQWTGSQKGTYPNQQCEYKHSFFDPKTRRLVTHVFWQACDN